MAVREQIHFLGVGGMGMLPLALLVAQAGYRVTGEDDNLDAGASSLLESASVEVAVSGFWEHGALPQRFVYSPAFDVAHPSRKRLSDAGVEGLSRGELLAELAGEKRLLAISGSHGKSSTTAALIRALGDVGFECSYYLGARFQGDDLLPAVWNDADWLIAEVDESDGSIDLFEPELSVITQIDFDHPSQYADAKAYASVFDSLRRRTRGTIIEGHPLEGAGLRLERERLVRETLAALGVEANADFLPELKRRQEVLHDDGSLKVIHDYAHHPAEIEALLSEPDFAGSTVVFEPHRYGRTAVFAEAFGRVLRDARTESVHLLPIYAAFEKNDGTRAESIAQSLPRAIVHTNEPEAFEVLLKQSSDGGRFLFVGAGTVDRFAEAFVADKVCIQRNVRLSGKTTMRVGGAAEYYAEPANLAELRAVLTWAKLKTVPVFPLGRGSNVIIPDEGISGLVIRLSEDAWKGMELLPDGRLRVGGGVRLRDICVKAAQVSMDGLEFMEGIPASLGGALRMNAGAMGKWMSDVVESVRLMEWDGSVAVYPREALTFAYRSTVELAQGFVLDAVLRGGSGDHDTDAIRGTMHTYMKSRKESQPREASAGCIFKNPEGDHAGRLIDVCGLKGHSRGGAMVSTIHANFIVNTGAATAADVLGLINEVRASVKAETGVLLEPEAVLLGNEWKEVLAG